MSLTRYDLFALASILTLYLIGQSLARRLPSRLAIHFGLNLKPDSFVSRQVGLGLMLGVGLWTWFIALVTARPFASLRAFLAVCLTLTLFGTIVLWNLGLRKPGALLSITCAVIFVARIVYLFVRGC
ncbi:MAG: hypothetical protein GX492_09480 [Firmicutes bacterium]|nr:hypothetical protein [Bacillota bacterium]